MVFIKRSSLPATFLIRTHETLPTVFACLYNKVIQLHGRVTFLEGNFRLHLASIFSISSQQSPLVFHHHTHTHITHTHVERTTFSVFPLSSLTLSSLPRTPISAPSLKKSPVHFSNFITEGFSDLLDSLRAQIAPGHLLSPQYHWVYWIIAACLTTHLIHKPLTWTRAEIFLPHPPFNCQ